MHVANFVWLLLKLYGAVIVLLIGIAAGEVHAPEVDAAIKAEMDELIAALSSKRRSKIEAAGERRRDPVNPSKAAS